MRTRRNWFSNFLPFDEPLIHKDISYSTVEHYFQAMKTIDVNYRKKVSICSTPGRAKRMGQIVPLRDNWEDIKVMHMNLALKYKFKRGTTWHKKLMQSKGDLVEWNYWHDNYWGNCMCNKCISLPAENILGILLMKLRLEHLRNEVHLKRKESLNEK